MMARFAALAIIPLLVGGCGLFSTPAEFDLVGPTVALMPLADAPRDAWYGESPRAVRLQTILRGVLSEEGVRLIDSDRINRELADVYEDNVPWVEYGRRMKAHFLVHGRITRCQIGDPKVVGYIPGDLTVELFVVDIERGQQVFWKQVSVRVPDAADRSGVEHYGLDTSEKTEAVLFHRCAKAWRQVFCGGGD